MKQTDFIKKRVLKVVNSRIRIEIKNNSLCQMDLCADLGANENDMNAFGSMMERLFNILIEDEELEKIKSVDDFVKLIASKSGKRVANLILENN